MQTEARMHMHTAIGGVDRGDRHEAVGEGIKGCAALVTANNVHSAASRDAVVRSLTNHNIVCRKIGRVG